MKKSLILLPLTAMLLSACALLPGGGGKKSSSSASGSASGSGSNPSQSSGQSGGGGGGGGGGDVDLPTAHQDSFASNMTAGEHTLTFDFNANYEDYKAEFPYVTIDTGLIGIYLDGMAVMSNNCFASAGYQGGANYLMMRNKKDSEKWADANGSAFIGNCVALGTISKVELTRGDSASTEQKYYVTFSDSLDTNPASSGTELSGTGDSATNSESGKTFFKITTKDKGKNGQIKLLKVTYTV